MNGSKKTVILYAPNVYVGGGKVLLIRLINEISKKVNLVSIVNSKIKTDIHNLGIDLENFYWIDGSLINYLKAEILLKKISSSESRILCFHGLPPLISRSCNIFVYAQNKLLFEKINIFHIPFRLTILIYLQKFIFLIFSSKARKIFVQTESMKSAIENNIQLFFRKNKSADLPKISIKPFFSLPLHEINTKLNGSKNYDFIFPSTAQPHKNHANLIEAWKLLASEDIYPSLAIPLTHPDLNLEQLVATTNSVFKTKICILNNLRHEDCLLAIKASTALIYPSLCESYGLPLVEADILQKHILASNRDFVFDVCNPTAVFDPNSPQSICEVTKNFLSNNMALLHTNSSRQTDQLEAMYMEIIS